MNRIERKLLTIVTESALEASLGEELRTLGATGYTIVNARGRGSRGVRDAGWSSSGNIRIEVVCDDDTAERIASYLRENYYRDFAMIVYVGDVEVLRPDKF
ncbi:MAG: transcriptional regulator [Pseudomonadota bacterium]